MKKLAALATLGLALGIPQLSVASDYMDIYTNPTVKSEVRSEVKGGSVEKDFTSFYITPKTIDVTDSVLSENESDDEGSYIVFGVRVPRSIGS
ncbi:MAG TPA: hypothetical protein VHT73_00890 [Thermodesulfobacteriota bacterium]|nr:hypothetical protein [Thermodesulfobacteriota bacterium]